MAKEQAAPGSEPLKLSTAFSVPLWMIASCFIAFLWAFYPTFLELADRWATDPQYSHCYLVPLFSLWLLWDRRGMISGQNCRPSWFGIFVLLLAIAIRQYSAVLFVNTIESAMIPIALAGVVLCIGGWKALNWAWPALAYLFFIVPLPYRVQTSLAQPLQAATTAVSTFVLQTVGLPAVSEGNVIVLDNARVGVVDACNGLGMMVTFFALAAAVAMVSTRPLIDRLVILLSAIPVAILSNVARVTITAFLAETVSPKLADAVFHDLAGWLMMPFALGVLWSELKLLSWLFPETLRFNHSPLDLGFKNKKMPAAPGI